MYITCGEPWKNPTVTKSDAQRRQLLTKLTADVKKIHEFCILRDTGEVVVSAESGIVPGSRLVVTQRIGKDLPDDESSKESKVLDDEKDSVDKETKDSRNCHQKSHAASDKLFAAKKYPWQQVKDEVSERREIEVNTSKEKSPRTPRSRSR